MLPDHVAVAVGDLLGKMGGVEIAAVDAGCLRRDERQRCYGEVLAEGVAGQIQLGEVGVRGEHAGSLAAQIHPGGGHDAEGAHVLIELLCTQLQTVGNKGRVAGVTYRLLKGLQAVTGLVGAVDGMAGDIHRTAAIDGGGLVDQSLLQRGGQRQDLEGGAGLIGVVQRLVAPLLLLGAFFVQLAPRHLLQQRLVGDGSKVVQVIVGEGGHGKDSAVAHVHNDTGGAVGGGEGVAHVLHALFQIVLHGGLQRYLQLVAVLRIKVLGVFIQQVILSVGLGGHHEAGLALQLLVILGLKAEQARVIHTHKADHLRGQIAVRIVALGVGGQENALDLVVVDVLPYLIGNILIHTVFQHLVHGVAAGHLFQDALLADVQNFCQRTGKDLLCPRHGVFPVVQCVIDLLGRQKDGLRRGGDGQNVAGGIVDGAAVGGDHAAAGLLADGLGLQLLVTGDLQRVQLEK